MEPTVTVAEELCSDPTLTSQVVSFEIHDLNHGFLEESTIPDLLEIGGFSLVFVTNQNLCVKIPICYTNLKYCSSHNEMKQKWYDMKNKNPSQINSLLFISPSTPVNDDLTFAREMYINEYSILNRIQHQNIIQLHNFTLLNSYIPMIATEYCPSGDLLEFLIHRDSPLSSTEAMPIYRQIIKGLNYAHSHGVIHRDLRLENVFMSSPTTVKIGDWGNALILDNSSIRRTHSVTMIPYYTPPEILYGYQFCGPEMDVWASGIILFALLSLIYPFNGEGLQLYQSIQRDPIPFDLIPKGGCDDKVTYLLVSVLNKDCIKRSTCIDILNYIGE